MTRSRVPRATERARQLRRRMTEAESVVWNELRRSQMGCRFRRQEVIGPFIVDSVCRQRRLVVEIDATQHFESAYDAARSRWLEGRGFTVLRFWNHEVLGNLEMVLDTIAAHVES